MLDALAAAGFDDLTASQGRIAAPDRPGGTRIGDLAEQALVTKQTATATVDRLERAGYVRRVPDPADARARLVVIGRAGEQAVKVAAGRRGRGRGRVGAPTSGRAGRTAAQRARADLREITDPYA